MIRNEPTTPTCPNCGCPHDQWQSETGYNGKYCCRACADGRECDCAQEDRLNNQKVGAAHTGGA